MKNALIKSTTVCALALWGATFLIPVSARAAVISLDTFDGSSANLLNGTTPSTTLGAFGATAGTTWGTVSGSPPSMSLNTSEYEANGSVTAQPFFLNDASLPFSPQANMIYTLSADMNATAGGSSWFSVSLLIANYGVATRILQRNTRGAGQGDVGSTTYNAAAGTVNLEIVLDTKAPQWTTQFFQNGSLSKGRRKIRLLRVKVQKLCDCGNRARP